ncbi:MAG TPA: hypothetical protein VF556_14320 [Pyrinomonadaceae bacterium]|jgi:hypothetical protein
MIAVYAETTGDEFIGYRHRGVARGEKLPNGVRDLGGGLLSDDNYDVTRFEKGNKFMLWFEKIIESDREGVPVWEVIDVLMFDRLKKNQKFMFSYSSTCTENSEENLDLIVLAETSPRKRNYKILRAWRANVEREKFEEVSTEAIRCRYAEGICSPRV